MQIFAKNQGFSQKSALFFAKIRKFHIFLQNFCDLLQNFATFSKNQLDSFVDLEKTEKMRIWLQNFVSIQPRTSLEKSDVSWPWMKASAAFTRIRTSASPPASLATQLFLLKQRRCPVGSALKFSFDKIKLLTNSGNFEHFPNFSGIVSQNIQKFYNFLEFFMKFRQFFFFL